MKRVAFSIIIIGFLGTYPRQDMLCAGPLIIAKREGALPLIVLWRLVEAYENLLRAAKVSYYFFTIDADDANAKWREIAEKVMGFTPYGVEGDLLVYRREIANGRITTITESA